jgi:hypothetical protein
VPPDEEVERECATFLVLPPEDSDKKGHLSLSGQFERMESLEGKENTRETEELIEERYKY